MSRVDILGTRVDNVSMAESLGRIATAVESDVYAYAVTPNVDHVMRLRRDGYFRKIYESADLVVPDGVPLVWASRLLGKSLKERVNGTDLFENACELAAERGYKLYLLGGNPGAAMKAGACLRIKYPTLRIVGSLCPEFGFDEDPSQNSKIQDQIRQSGADILFVGLGAPKQEQWIYQYARGSGVRFAVGIGISFSFVAGELSRAPVWMQRSGLEWLWRLISEPRRLWKRYLVEDMPFLLLILVASIQRRTRAVWPPLHRLIGRSISPGTSR